MRNMFFIILSILTLAATSQTWKPDLNDAGKWQPVNREVKSSSEGVMEINAKTGEGMFVLKDSRFSEGVISIRLQGENKQGQSFVGIAFHIKDEKNYEAVYFRPFNFQNKERETHSVQYVSMPDYPWEKLRQQFPGKYENKIEPAPDPDGWLDAKIVIKGKLISVYVNNASAPSLEVESLSPIQDGKIAVWVGNNSKGTFKDLQITPAQGSPTSMNVRGPNAGGTAISTNSLAVPTNSLAVPTNSMAVSTNTFTSNPLPSNLVTEAPDPIPYGNNPSAGKYFDVGDAKLYYEVYGKGDPILLLHGGVYGYIDEFSQLITELSTHYRVICLATRGHGKSEAGHAPFTYEQRASDAYKFPVCYFTNLYLRS